MLGHHRTILRLAAAVSFLTLGSCASGPTTPGATSHTQADAANATVLTQTSGGSIVDSAGNVWTLTSDGRVQENGNDVPGGSGTATLAYVNGQIYGQDAASGNWYAFTDGVWVGPQASPLPATDGPQVSAADTTVPPAARIVDAQGNVWTLVATGGSAGNQIALNGTVDPVTQQVHLLLYHDDSVFQQSTWGWYRWDGGGWTQVSADPRTSTSAPQDTTVPPASSIVDAQGNVWTLVATGGSAGNQIALNGTVDPITQQVQLLLYHDNSLFQQSTWGWYRWDGSEWTQVPGDPRTATPPPPPPPPPPPGQGVHWGCSTDATYLQPIANNGFTPGMGDFYIWDPNGDAISSFISYIDNYLSDVQSLNQRWGVVPLWSIGMGTGSQDFDDIAKGAYDNVWQHAVSATAALGIDRVYIRPGWEMNGTWFPWSVNADNSASFINAWRHIYQVVHAQGAASGITVLVDYAPAESADDSLCWPGPDFVDVISLDTGSMLYSDVSNSGPLATDVVSTLTMAQRAVAYGKLFGISELAADNGEWGIVLPNHLQALQMVPGVQIDHFCFTNWETNANGSTAYQDSPEDNAAVQSFMTSVTSLR